MDRNVSNVEVSGAAQQPPQPTQPYVVRHDFGEAAELTTTLAHAISDVTGVDVTDTGFTLAEYVDPDALDDLFKPVGDGTPRPSGQLGFDIWGYHVVVYSDGRIVITRQRTARQPTQAPY